jgi:hypothetical protein
MPTSWARTAIPDAMLNARPADIDTMATTGAERMSAAERLEQRADLFGRHNFCFLAEQAEPGIAALAAELAVKPLADDQKALTRDELVAYIRAQVFIGVTAHEVGHTLGLRHNFEGSADPLNFFPNFWGVDTGDHRMSENGRNHEVQYSTIMDYMQRFNSDFGGIGLYDKAAIKFGYGGKVEVFDEREEHFVPSDSYWDRNLDLFDPTDLPFLLAGNGANAELDRHYDGVYNSYVDGNDNAEINVQGGTNIQPKPANLFRRRDIDVKDWMKQEMLRVVGQNNDDGAPVSIAVPYKYCSDAFAYGGNLKCNRWDMGTTSSEIVKNAAEMYDFYYPFDAFRRDRASNGWASGYMNRVYSRTYQPMLNAFRYFYYYRRSGARIWPEIKDWSKASLSGMNFFLRVLSTPEPGEYCLDNGNYVPKASAATCEKTVTLGIDQARFYDTSYDVNQEYRPNNMGHFYDKGLAIMAMTDTNAFFLRDFSNLTNRSAFSIGYYRVFAPEMIKLYGGLIRGENEVYSSRIVDGPSGPEVVPPRFLGAGTGTIENPAAGNRVPPSDSFQLRNWALFYAMGNLSTPLDQTLDFASRARITLAGSASDPTTAIDPSKVVEFTDPVSHYIYRAVAVDGPEQSIGFTLLTDAKTFAAGPWQAAKAALAAAEASPATDDDGPAQAAFQRANARLNDKLGMIDNVRRLGDAYGAGAN